MTMEVAQTVTVDYTSITALLQSLASSVVQDKLNETPQDPSHTLTSAGPLFAALHAVNRSSLNSSKVCKARIQDARLKMDSAHLRLQNLLFERNHLEREIRKCEEFESEYQLLPLLDVDELASLASSSTPPTGLSTPLPEDPHELMLVRLAFELSERQRFDDEKKELGTMKTKLVKENQAAKERLEAVEKQMDDFLTDARAIQTKMQGS